MLKTSKFHIENYIFWPFIRIFWEPFSGKRSHWWNWNHIDKEFEKAILIKGEKINYPLTNLWHALIELNFRWKKLAIIEPTNYKGEYQLAYKSNIKKEICSIIVKGKIACLVNSNDTQYTAYSYPNGKEIKIEVKDFCDKRNLEKGILFI